jgi:ubiquinone/menaquinone biosynthesis C-methylase UbiE
MIDDNPTNMNSVILDQGTGTGFLVKKILKKGLGVIGLDLLEHMLAIAKKNAPDALLVRGDAENIYYIQEHNIKNIHRFFGIFS